MRISDWISDVCSSDLPVVKPEPVREAPPPKVEPKPVSKPVVKPEPKPKPKPDRKAVRVETKQKPLRPSKRVAVSTAVSAASANKPQDKAVASSKPVSSADTDKPRWITNVAYPRRPPRPHYLRAAQRRGDRKSTSLNSSH